MVARSGTLADAFDSRRNGFDTIRLGFATLVIIWHAVPLTGHVLRPASVEQFVGSFRADGFFALSGFLILSSWLRRPDARGFVRARLLRIFPAFWVCLVVTAFGIAPLALWASGESPSALFTGEHNSWHYVISSLATYQPFQDIAGTPGDVPHPGMWNGTIWTLRWELIAYTLLLALGVLGLARRRSVLLAVAVAAWVVLLMSSLGATPWVPVGGLRCAVMFSSGAALFAYRDVVPARGWLAGVALALIGVGLALPDYRLTGGIALAYLVVWTGTRLQDPRWRRVNDFSYGMFLYGYPVQQGLLMAGWPWLNPAVFAVVSVVATVPFAVASWFLVERPVARWKRRGDERRGLRPSPKLAEVAATAG